MDGPRYVVLVTNNDDSPPATLHDSLASAKDWVRAWLTDPENEPPMEREQLAQAFAELDAMIGGRLESVRGSDAWKEWIYIAPVEETVIVSTCRRINDATVIGTIDGTSPWAL